MHTANANATKPGGVKWTKSATVCRNLERSEQ